LRPDLPGVPPRASIPDTEEELAEAIQWPERERALDREAKRPRRLEPTPRLELGTY
jgi:hypothetical protein